MRPKPPGLAALAPLAFLAASLLVIAILAWQAFAAAAGHRALANRVLQDYADLAATELVRRGSTFVFTYGFDVAAQALARVPGTASGAASGPVPSHEAIAAAMPSQSKRAIELVGGIVRVDVDAGVIAGEDALSEPVGAALLRELREASPSRAPSQVVVVTVDGPTRVFVFAGDGPGTDGSRVRLGFEARLGAIGAWLREFVLREPLLPPSLAARDAAQSALSVAVTAPDGTMIVGALAFPRATDSIVAERPWIDEGSRRALPGFDVISTIDPAAASSLIIGGVPRTRVAPLLTLLALAIAMAVGAVVQLRRERALADLRNDFVTRTSHELRTPVSRIRMFTETLLLDRVRTDQERREAVHAIDRASRRLALLVENVLQFSRAEAGARGLRLEHTDLVSFVRQVVTEFETTVNATQPLTIVAPQAVDVTIDREETQQALMNLLDNAWKYGGTERSIGVEISASGEETRIRVSDAGPGVPMADRRRVWDAYVRLDRDRRSSIAGTGIGLAVVKDIVVRHGGRCWIETAKSGGAAFVIVLPQAHRAAEAEKADA